jgi:hypothetical protein
MDLADESYDADPVLDCADQARREHQHLCACRYL